MEKVVITGADGFIGRHFIDKCVDEEIEVWAIVHPKSPNRERLSGKKNVHIIVCEIENLLSIQEDFPKEIDCLYHFAWAGVNANDRDDFECQKQNIELSMKVIEFAGLLNIRKFVMPGSTNEYLYYGKPIDGNAIPSPSNAYGATKVAIRYLAQNYAKKYNMEFVYVVVTGVYSADRKDNNVIFYTIDKLLKGEKPSLTKLEQLWDYVYIDDVVEGFYLIGEKGKNDAFYTIGKGDNQPLYKYIETIRNLINPHLALGIGEVPYKDDKMPSSCTDLTAISMDTGYIPKIEFEDGIIKVICKMREEV